MADGMFIQVEVDEQARDNPVIAQKLEDACPVDIFENAHGRVEIVERNLDECVLCGLCIEAAPAGTVRVRKLYSDEVLQSR
jgi:NAD-dependent dihydropyrimidine dehydrogenase PreA subunit